MPVVRVTHTPAAAELIGKLRAAHGALAVPSVGRMLRRQRADVLSARRIPHRPARRISRPDRRLPVYISGPQFEYWQHTHLIIDAVPGRGSGFSLKSPEGLRFLTRSRVFTEAEIDELERMGPPPRGPEAMAASRVA